MLYYIDTLYLYLNYNCIYIYIYTLGCLSHCFSFPLLGEMIQCDQHFFFKGVETMIRNDLQNVVTAAQYVEGKEVPGFGLYTNLSGEMAQSKHLRQISRIEVLAGKLNMSRSNSQRFFLASAGFSG